MSSNIYDTLRELVEWTAPPETLVLSLYLDISPGQQADAADFARAACEELLEQHEGTPDAAAFTALVQRRLERLPETVQRARRADYDGLALFLCAKPPLSVSVSLRFPFENQALVGRDPFLRHLLRVAEEYERSVCVVLTPVSAQICEIHIGDLARVHDVAPTKRREMPREVAVHLARMVREDPALHVILFGAPADLEVLEAVLGQDVQTRIIDRLDQVLAPGQPEFLRAVHRCLQDYERRTEEEGVTRLLRLRQEEQEVAVGLDETLETINRGRIKKLFALQSFERSGWLCDVCDYLGSLPAPPFCIACGASVSVVPLEEHLLDQAAACGAEIETVYESAALADVGGVGALID
jgi:hypothetical protein